MDRRRTDSALPCAGVIELPCAGVIDSCVVGSEGDIQLPHGGRESRGT